MTDCFEYSVNFGLENNEKIVRNPPAGREVEIPLHLKINTKTPVEMGSHRIGGINAGFRVYHPDTLNLIYEGRLFDKEFVAFPGQWIPLSIKFPIEVMGDYSNVVVHFDLVKENHFWFVEKGGHKHSFVLEITTDLDAGVLPIPTLVQSWATESSSGIEGLQAQLVSEAMPQKSPSRVQNSMAEANLIARSALSNVFRMNGTLIDLSPEEFRDHCYRTLLRRDPEPSIAAQSVDFADVQARIAYWQAIILSQEFDAGEAVLLRDDIILKLLESMGWSVSNVLLGYALRIECISSGTFQNFIQRLGRCLVRNSYHSSHIDVLYENESPGLKYHALFEGLVDLAVEFSVGIARLDVVLARVEELEKRSNVTVDQTAILSTDSDVDILSTDADAVESSAITTPPIDSLGEIVTPRRRKPKRWVLQ